MTERSSSNTLHNQEISVPEVVTINTIWCTCSLIFKTLYVLVKIEAFKLVYFHLKNNKDLILCYSKSNIDPEMCTDRQMLWWMTNML